MSDFFPNADISALFLSKFLLIYDFFLLKLSKKMISENASNLICISTYQAKLISATSDRKMWGKLAFSCLLTVKMVCLFDPTLHIFTQFCDFSLGFLS